MKAKIFNIARCSLHDGDGIRTVVYMKGCTLRCLWCHNPESISQKTEILFQKSRCIKCGRCVEVCPENHVISGDEVFFMRNTCSFCMKCVEACPSEALTACGKDMTVEEVFSEIIKDVNYFEASGGGVTISGGECLLYPDFLIELCKMCKDAKINTAIETAFNIEWNNIEVVRNYINTFIIDIKQFDSDIHKRFTGSGNQLIISNIKRISLLHSSIWIRIPLIPNVNDDDENLVNTAKLINTFGSGIKTIELLKYNNMAGNKYVSLGKETILFTDYVQDDKVMEQKCNLIKNYVSASINVIY